MTRLHVLVVDPVWTLTRPVIDAGTGVEPVIGCSRLLVPGIPWLGAHERVENTAYVVEGGARWGRPVMSA